MTPLRIHLSALDDARRTAIAAWLHTQSAGYMQVVDGDHDVAVVLGGTEVHPGSAPLVWRHDAGATVANLPPSAVAVATDDELLGALWMHEMQRDFCALEVP